MKIYIFIFVLLISINLSAQKNEIGFVEAKQIATENNKKILLIFKGSDWCAPCIKLEKEILDTQEFKDLSENSFVTISADFPRKKKNKLSKEKQAKNNSLAEKYNPSGYFPYVVILSSDGNKLGSLGYLKTTPSDYFKKINAFK